MPTQPPCCQTWQLSHWMNMPPVSGSLMPSAGGGPGYSFLPQIHRVTSSSPSSSLALSVCNVSLGSEACSCSRFWRRVRRVSVSCSSEFSDDDLTLGSFPPLILAGRSARLLEEEGDEFLRLGWFEGSWTARARELRRGDTSGIQ